MRLIGRSKLLRTLISWQHQDVIKVITGVRRSGKSTLFDLYENYLYRQGVRPEQIIRINLEDLARYHFQTYEQLHDYVLNLIRHQCQYYVLIDEVQMIDGWQRAINSLFLRKNVDIYITGSNAHILSGELATLLSGRFVTINVFPYSFAEYTQVLPQISDRQQLYNHYVMRGGFPYAASLSDPQQAAVYLRDLYNTIILKDVVTRRKVQDVALLERLVLYLMDNIGNLASTHSIVTSFQQNGNLVSGNTIDGYLSALTNAYIFYRADRYDIRGRQLLKTGDKYYVVDPGLRYYLLRARVQDQGRLLENVVYLELLRRGYQVYVGQADKYEIDFVAIKANAVEYYQVAASVRQKETLERELRSLLQVKDNHPKTLITLDYDPEMDYDGIKQKFVLDWLLE